MELLTGRIDKPTTTNFILGQTHLEERARAWRKSLLQQFGYKL
jgi:hypothetical protein